MGGPLPIPGMRDGSRPLCGDQDSWRQISDRSREDTDESLDGLAETGCNPPFHEAKVGIHPEDNATEPHLGKELGQCGEGNGEEGLPTFTENNHTVTWKSGGLGLPNVESDLDVGWASQVFKFLTSKDPKVVMMCARCLRDTIAAR